MSVAFMVWVLGFMDGWMGEMVRGATAVVTGQVQVTTRAFADNPRVYTASRPAWRMLEKILAVDGVEAVSPRLELNGLIGHERKSQVARIFGVDPDSGGQDHPHRGTRWSRAGGWLKIPPAYPSPSEVVLGSGVRPAAGRGAGRRAGGVPRGRGRIPWERPPEGGGGGPAPPTAPWTG